MFLLFKTQFKTGTPVSCALSEHTILYLPGGAADDGKVVVPYSIYVKDAQGGEYIDVDGNHHVDLSMSGMHNDQAAEANVLLARNACQSMPHGEVFK